MFPRPYDPNTNPTTVRSPEQILTPRLRRIPGRIAIPGVVERRFRWYRDGQEGTILVDTRTRVTPMKGSEPATVFHEVADIITLLEYRYPKPIAKKLHQAAKLLMEAGNIIARLPDDSDRPFPPEDQDAFIQKLERQDAGSTPLQDIAWALEKFQPRYARPIARKLRKASALIQEAAEMEG